MTVLQDKLKEYFAGRVILGGEIETRYLTDFVGFTIGNAEALVKAQSRDDVVAALKIAHELKAPVTVRGAGTNLVGSTIPSGGMVLDVSGLNHILELDEENLAITVEPGVILADLIAYVEERGYFYPPDPAEKQASIGGNISTNAGGMRAVKYGVTRDFVLALELVKTDGTVINLGSKNLKDSTALNLKQLVVGSEGTLGVITKATLKLLVKPERTEHVLLSFDSLAAAIGAVTVLFKEKLAPTAVEFVEKSVIAYGERYLNRDFPEPNAKAYLIVTFDGSSGEIETKLRRIDVMRANGAVGILPLTDPEVAENVWSIRAALARAVKDSGIWEPVDTVVPLNQIAAFVGFVNELAEKERIRIVAFGHAGDGNVHLCIIKDDIPLDKWPQRLQSVLTALYHKVYALGGLTAAEHGIGKSKRRYFLENTPPENVDLMRAVKAAFDPDNQLNRGSGYSR